MTNEQSLREALEPCCFCAADIEENPPSIRDHDLHGLETTFRYVECSSCGACGPRRATKREASAAWNTRQALSRPAMSEEDAARLIAFLNGEGPLDGRWFGDPDEKGHVFWWRKYLPAIRAASERKEG